MRILAAVFGVLLLVSGGPSAGSTEIKFHHVHYRVGDPSAAMADAARRFNGTRVIVPGLGVGVRVGNEYLLFDRDDSGDEAPEQPPFAEAYNAASDWLARQMLPSGRVDVPATVMPDLRPDHVAFATYGADFPAVIEAIAKRSSVTVLERRADSLLFAVAGLRIEIVRDTNRPDVFWCPMHPDVRAPEGGKCSLCGMDLVAIPPPSFGEYRLDVVVDRTRRGVRGFRFTVRDPGTDALVRDFAVVHEKQFHLFIVSRDLEYFAHVHPGQQPDGTFLLQHELEPGEYMLIADFLPQGGTSQMVQRAVVAGEPASEPFEQRAPGQHMATQASIVDGARVALKVEDFEPGKYARMTFTLADEKTGEPVTNVEPYLGAAAHMLLVRADLRDVVHAHPETVTTATGGVSFHVLVPAAGEYKLWVQFQRAGRVMTVPFSVSTPLPPRR